MTGGRPRWTGTRTPSRPASPRGVGGFQTSPMFIDQKLPSSSAGRGMSATSPRTRSSTGASKLALLRGRRRSRPRRAPGRGGSTRIEEQGGGEGVPGVRGAGHGGQSRNDRSDHDHPREHRGRCRVPAGTRKARRGEQRRNRRSDHLRDQRTRRSLDPVSVGYVQFESLINKAFADIRNGADVGDRLAQAEQQIEDAWSQLK